LLSAPLLPRRLPRERGFYLVVALVCQAFPLCAARTDPPATRSFGIDKGIPLRSANQVSERNEAARGPVASDCTQFSLFYTAIYLLTSASSQGYSILPFARFRAGVASLRPERVLFRSGGVDLRAFLCGVPIYVRLRTSPRFPCHSEKSLLSESKTRSVSSGISEWTLAGVHPSQRADRRMPLSRNYIHVRKVTKNARLFTRPKGKRRTGPRQPLSGCN
jgi:hypothetical protein